MLDDLEEVGGPFTPVEQVESFLITSLDEKEKKKRLKQEIHYARDITSFPFPLPRPTLCSG